MPISAAQLLGLVEIRGADEGALKLLRVGAAADDTGAKLAGLAVGGAVLAAAGMIAAGAAAVKMDADLQQGINRLKTGGGDIQDTFASLRTGIQSVALMSGELTGPLTDAMYLIVSAGQRGAQAFATEAAAAQGAQIEMANVVDVTKILTTLQTNWGISTYTATQYMDGLISVVSHGKITLEDLSTNLSSILPIAAEFGISFKDIASAMAVQTNAGLDAAKAATGLQAVMVNMENPTVKASKAMKQYGVDSIAVANEMKVSLPGAFQMLIDAALKVGPMGSVPFNRAMADMIGGGTRTAKTIDALDQHTKDWLTDIALMKTAMGDTSANVAGWETAQSNLNVQLQRGQAFLQVLGQNVGEVLLPYVSQLLADILPLGEGFAAWATSTQGLAGYINQLAAFVTYLVRDLQGNGAIKEFGMIMSDIGQTVGNVVNTALSLLGTIFGTTASQAGKASDAASNVANGLKRVLDTVKPLTDALSWLTSQFTDAGVKGQILRGILITVGATIAAIKFVEFGTSAVTAFTNAGIAAFGFGQKLIGVQVAATAAGTATAGAGTAATGAATSFAATGAAMVPLIGIAAGVALALTNIHSVLADPMPSGQNTLWGQIQGISVGGLWNGIQQNARTTSQVVQNAWTTMQSGVVGDTRTMQVGVEGQVGAMSGWLYNQWGTMSAQAKSQSGTLSDDAIANFKLLNIDVSGQASQMDDNVKGYWNDVAQWIRDHPINGQVDWTMNTPSYASTHIAGVIDYSQTRHSAAGMTNSPGIWSWVGERGKELMYVPPGASIIPHQQSERIAAGGASGHITLNLTLQTNGQTYARAIIPDIVQVLREATGAKF